MKRNASEMFKEILHKGVYKTTDLDWFLFGSVKILNSWFKKSGERFPPQNGIQISWRKQFHALETCCLPGSFPAHLSVYLRDDGWVTTGWPRSRYENAHGDSTWFGFPDKPWCRPWRQIYFIRILPRVAPPWIVYRAKVDNPCRIKLLFSVLRIGSLLK